MGNSVLNTCKNKEPLAEGKEDGGLTLEEQQLEARRRRRAKRKERDALSAQISTVGAKGVIIPLDCIQQASFGEEGNSFIKHAPPSVNPHGSHQQTECQTPHASQQANIRENDVSQAEVDKKSLKNNNDSYFSKEDLNHYQQKYASDTKSPQNSQKLKNNSIRWKQAEVLGMGSFGQVILGWNIDTGEMMAVKQVHIGGYNPNDRKEKITQIQSEIEALQTLSNKNIVRYIGVKKSETSINIFLEHVPGGSISSLLFRYGKFNETLIRQFTRQILKGLEYLHAHEIIHRDIKGANVLVDKDGNCKLAGLQLQNANTDFGSAKKIVEEKGKNDSIRGTPYWMAPETIKQAGSGRFADIWSIGCTVIEMATAKPPWADKSPIQAMFQIANATDPPPIPGDLSSDCRDFVANCLKINPKERLNVRQLLSHQFLVKRRRYTQRQITERSVYETNTKPRELTPTISIVNQQKVEQKNQPKLPSSQSVKSKQTVKNPSVLSEQSIRNVSDCIDHSFSQSSFQGSMNIMLTSSDSSSSSSDCEEEQNKNVKSEIIVKGQNKKEIIYAQQQLTTDRRRSIDSALQPNNTNQQDSDSVSGGMGFILASDLNDFVEGVISSKKSKGRG